MKPPPRPPAVTPSRGVPAEVEAWWLAEARRATGARSDVQALGRLVPVVQALSDGFTKERPAEFERYGDDDTARAAYALWFGSQAWVRTRLPLALARAVHGWTPPARPLRLLDVGAAGGAAGLSLATWLRGAPGVEAVELVALDHARAPLKDLERLAREALAPAQAPRVLCAATDVRRIEGLPATAQGPFDVIVISFTLNELWPAGDVESPEVWLGRLAERLAPDGLLLVLEPGVKEQAERLVGLTADLVERRGLFAWGPQHGPGTWRPGPDTRTWPHEVRRWVPPPSVRRMNQTLRRDAHELTFSYALLSPTPPPAPPDLPQRFRLASLPRRLRGRRTWLAYDATGGLVMLELQDRDAERSDIKRLEACERGDVWCCSPAPRTVGIVLRLGAGSEVVSVLTPDGARAGVPPDSRP